MRKFDEKTKGEAGDKALSLSLSLCFAKALDLSGLPRAEGRVLLKISTRRVSIPSNLPFDPLHDLTFPNYPRNFVSPPFSRPINSRFGKRRRDSRIVKGVKGVVDRLEVW